MNNPKYIKDWNELKNETSPTHILLIEDACGWIEPKEGKEKLGEKYVLFIYTHFLWKSIQKIN